MTAHPICLLCHITENVIRSTTDGYLAPLIMPQNSRELSSPAQATDSTIMCDSLNVYTQRLPAAPSRHRFTAT